MGLPEWKGGTARIIVLCLSCVLAYTQADLSGGCNVEPCWELYQEANAYYQADVPGVSNAVVRKCIVFRSYKSCLLQMDTSGCAGALNYQSSRRALQSEFRKNNCSEEGPVYPEGPEPEQTEEITPCKYNGRAVYSYCALFGDPHLVTFRGVQSTCKLEGAWPLIDNSFFTVQVTNAPLSASTKAATVTHKVTVVIKGRGSSSPSGTFCGSRDAVFYHAEIGSLPTAFTDGMQEYGAFNSIQVNTVTPGEQVEIYMRHIDSRVIIRQINNQYLSVGIRMPEKVLNDSIGNPDIPAIRQLCVNSCPVSERVDIVEQLGDLSAGTSTQQVAYANAQKTCRDQGVTDFFFDSCVFDLLMTGENLFSNMAASAYQDVKKYASRQPRWSNRTFLVEQALNGVTDHSATGVADASSHSSAGGKYGGLSLLIRTLLFVYIMHILSFIT